ncbi:MAG: hypothetical protein M1834_006572 [Cirrosporium novae-zelandiae]|nr:MAG: hypothetical protein M1834_006572 [Cirrosporium novae-zelandiae]
MIISRLISFLLRVGEFAFAAVVVGIIGHYLAEYGAYGRFIYTEVIAALSILLALFWMLPFTGNMLHYPMDFILTCAWFAAFGILVNKLHHLSCGSIWYWHNITDKSDCGKWKAAEAFSFMSAIFWLASALLGVYVYHRLGRPVAADTVPSHRRRWYGRRSQV